MKHIALLALIAAAGFAQSDPWSAGELMQPEQLAAQLKSTSAKPILIEVSFPVLYRNRHIPGAVYAGPGSRPEGLAALKKAVAGVPKTREVVIYCGCCPMDKCPNIRPAYLALRDMGFQRIRVVSMPTNFAKDWADKGYPVERPSAAPKP